LLDRAEIAIQAEAIVYGGVTLMLRVARESGFDRGAPIFKWRCPYCLSDHVLNMAMNTLCEGTCREADRVMALCREGGFQRIRLRGDKDFSQTEHLDRWDDVRNVRFQFGYD